MEHLKNHIAQTVRTLRQHRGWSLDITSQQTGVSKAMLGQIERGESSPTVKTLWKIAAGFEITFSSLVNVLEKPLSGLEPLHPQNENLKIKPLLPHTPSPDREIFIIELLPGSTHLSGAHRVGTQELVLVIQGEIEILVAKVWHRVNIHESFEFRADHSHGYRNKTKTPVLFHNIIHYKS